MLISFRDRIGALKGKERGSVDTGREDREQRAHADQRSKQLLHDSPDDSMPVDWTVSAQRAKRRSFGSSPVRSKSGKDRRDQLPEQAHVDESSYCHSSGPPPDHASSRAAAAFLLLPTAALLRILCLFPPHWLSERCSQSPKPTHAGQRNQRDGM